MNILFIYLLAAYVLITINIIDQHIENGTLSLFEFILAIFWVPLFLMIMYKRKAASAREDASGPR